MENAKELQKLAQVFNTDNIITNDDIEQVLKGILVIMNSFKKDNQSLNKETKEIVENLFNKILTEHDKLKESVNRETSDVKNEIQEKLATSLKEIKSLMEEVKSMKPKDGLDAVVDEEKIVQDVLSQIKLPEQKEIILDTPEEIANKLESLTGEARLDASAIKNLPTTTVKGGGVRLLQYLADVNIQSPANNDVLKYNSTSKLWENGTGGGGGGAVDSVNGQTGVVVLDADDIDDTSTTNKFVTSADLTKLSNLSGTNTGDQTSIVGITGTKAEFDTAVTDGNFLYVGDITQYTDEMAQDAVGGILNNSTFINLTYSDATPSITASLNATGTPSSSTYLRGDNTWATIGGGGDVTKVGTPVNNQIGVWTGDGTIEGTSGLTYDGSNLLLTGDLGSTGSRITKGWFTDLQVTNAISGSITGNAGTVTNATLTTALTVNTGTVTLTGNVANNSVLTIGAGAVSVSGTNTGDQTTISGNAGSATVLATPRAIYGNNFDGSAALTQIIASTYGGTGNGFTKFSGATTTEKTYTLPDASTTILTKNYTGALATGIVKNTTTTGELSIAVAGDFPTLNQNTTGSAATLTTTRTIWGQNFNGSANVTGDITLGTGNITMTGSIGATGARVTKGWFTDLEVTNAIAGSITGNAATVSSANEASDTTCFPLFITASGTQTLATKNNTNLTFNASTASLGSTIFNAGTGFQIGGAASSGKILKANGTNFVASTETYAAPGATGNVMTSDGTNWTSAAPAASGSSTAVDSTQSVYNNYEIEFSGSGATPTGDTWNVNGTLNAATRWNGKLFRVTFGTNTDITQFLPGNIGSSSAFLQFGNGKDIYISFNAKFSSVSGQVGIGISDSTDAFYAVSNDGGKLMFTYNGTTLNAVNGETSETTTDVSSGITRTNWNNYRIHYRYGTDVRFYINNTLVATHTTNLPTSSSNARFGIGGATSGNTAELANVVISVEQ